MPGHSYLTASFTCSSLSAALSEATPRNVIGAILRCFGLAHEFFRHLWIGLTPVVGQMAHQHRGLLNGAHRVPNGLLGGLTHRREQAVRRKSMPGVAAIAQTRRSPHAQQRTVTFRAGKQGRIGMIENSLTTFAFLPLPLRSP
jgi:hypothetical protein